MMRTNKLPRVLLSESETEISSMKSSQGHFSSMAGGHVSEGQYGRTKGQYGRTPIPNLHTTCIYGNKDTLSARGGV